MKKDLQSGASDEEEEEYEEEEEDEDFDANELLNLTDYQNKRRGGGAASATPVRT